MLDTVQQQHARLKDTYKAQLSIEKADRKELERLLKEEQTKRETAEREAAAAQREKEALAAQTKEREMQETIARERAQLDAERAKLMAEMAAFRYERDNRDNTDPSTPTKAVRRERPSTPRHESRGSSQRSRSSVTFKENAEIMECREASPTRSRLGNAVTTAMTVGGAALTTAIAIPLVGGLLAVDAIKYVRGEKTETDESTKSSQADQAKPKLSLDATETRSTSGHRRRWSVATTDRDEVVLGMKKEEARWSKMSNVD